MNKYSELNKEQRLEICKMIHPDTQWRFHQLIDNDGKGTDECYEFLGNDGSIIQFNIHQSEFDVLRFYKQSGEELLEIGEETLKFFDNEIDDYLHRLNNKSQDVENKNSSEEFLNSKEDEIKSFFLVIEERDEFTKSQKFYSNTM